MPPARQHGMHRYLSSDGRGRQREVVRVEEVQASRAQRNNEGRLRLTRPRRVAMSRQTADHTALTP